MRYHDDPARERPSLLEAGFLCSSVLANVLASSGSKQLSIIYSYSFTDASRGRFFLVPTIAEYYYKPLYDIYFNLIRWLDSIYYTKVNILHGEKS